jgi:hypothetical protein
MGQPHIQRKEHAAPVKNLRPLKPSGKTLSADYSIPEK